MILILLLSFAVKSVLLNEIKECPKADTVKNFSLQDVILIK